MKIGYESEDYFMSTVEFVSSLNENVCSFANIQNSYHDCLSANHSDTKKIAFATGKVDDWCVYILQADAQGVWYAHAVKDSYYFERLYWLGTLTNAGLSLRKVHGHMVELFVRQQINRGKVDNQVVDWIDKVTVEQYGPYSDMAKELFMLVYYGMIGEENRVNTKLGSLIKILGLTKLLVNQDAVDVASNCMCGKPWQSIKAECDALGFTRLL